MCGAGAPGGAQSSQAGKASDMPPAPATKQTKARVRPGRPGQFRPAAQTTGWMVSASPTVGSVDECGQSQPGIGPILSAVEEIRRLSGISRTLALRTAAKMRLGSDAAKKPSRARGAPGCSTASSVSESHGIDLIIESQGDRHLFLLGREPGPVQFGKRTLGGEHVSHPLPIGCFGPLQLAPACAESSSGLYLEPADCPRSVVLHDLKLDHGQDPLGYCGERDQQADR